jgi:hypothetical protein
MWALVCAECTTFFTVRQLLNEKQFASADDSELEEFTQA